MSTSFRVFCFAAITMGLGVNVFDCRAASAQEVAQEAAQENDAAENAPTPKSTQVADDGSDSDESDSANEELLDSLPPEILEAGNKAKAEFLEIKSQLVQSIGDMRATQIHFLNEDDSSPAAADRYRQIRNESRDLMNQLFESGLDVIRQIPDKEVLQYIMTIIEHRMKHDYYDSNSMEAGARLIDGGFQNSFIFLGTMRAAIVNGDFELARRLIEVLNVEKLEEFDQKLVYLVDDLEKQHQEDQELQRQDDEKNNNPRVKMVTTRGDVTIELFINQAPSTVANFIELVEQGYYDGLDFYQVIDHLLALTGDTSGTGEGNTGKFIVDEQDRPDRRHGLAGSLIMAKHPLGDGSFVPNSASAQFAILMLPIVVVSKNQTVFGRVIEGMDVICELRRVDPSKKKEKNAIVLPPDRILSMEMIRRPETLPEVKYFDPMTANNPHAGHAHGPSLPSPSPLP